MSETRAKRWSPGPELEVNDVHSGLNATRVRDIVQPSGTSSLVEAVLRAAAAGHAICVAGSRHAMGGQQFATAATLLDMTGMNRVLAFDSERGLVTVEGGVGWDALVEWLIRSQPKSGPAWGIRQKQTGADALTVGGALSANAHGRGLSMKPIVDDVESFQLVGPDGRVRRCSRVENRELFSLAVGGYGLFGVIGSVTLRLTPRVKLARVVEELHAAQLMPAFEQRIQAGALYGDFQFAIDEDSESFLTSGLLSCYEPVPEATTIPAGQRELTVSDWRQLLFLAHADKAEAYRRYRTHYLSTSGQVYWSDSHQLGLYLPGYHEELDQALGATIPGSEMIGEFYVPRTLLAEFLQEAAAALRERHADVIYGTVRLIEAEEESFLAWASQPFACIVLNLHVEHSSTGIRRCADAFGSLIDLAAERGGSYLLTYHRWAGREQVERCYPQFTDFLTLKQRYDPQERFQSDWYRHYKEVFADRLS